ncbi:Kinesin-Like Protein Kif28P [Manis pentadactyla]|nr:Kinesin-Like Protein Kif28P [Manis pentadactyla]
MPRCSRRGSEERRVRRRARRRKGVAETRDVRRGRSEPAPGAAGVLCPALRGFQGAGSRLGGCPELGRSPPHPSLAGCFAFALGLAAPSRPGRAGSWPSSLRPTEVRDPREAGSPSSRRGTESGPGAGPRCSSPCPVPGGRLRGHLKGWEAAFAT